MSAHQREFELHLTPAGPVGGVPVDDGLVDAAVAQAHPGQRAPLSPGAAAMSVTQAGSLLPLVLDVHARCAPDGSCEFEVHGGHRRARGIRRQCPMIDACIQKRTLWAAGGRAALVARYDAVSAAPAASWRATRWA